MIPRLIRRVPPFLAAFVAVCLMWGVTVLALAFGIWTVKVLWHVILLP